MEYLWIAIGMVGSVAFGILIVLALDDFMKTRVDRDDD
jgi:uncharacterized protein involved in exopolysaccharide biosynthesis